MLDVEKTEDEILNSKLVIDIPSPCFIPVKLDARDLEQSCLNKIYSWSSRISEINHYIHYMCYAFKGGFKKE